ncbi:MAG: hypothetical protein LBU46_06030 [Candidatus Accumulibacter sp.]|nr:hypothetical protein [Accumulibacter sp.]
MAAQGRNVAWARPKAAAIDDKVAPVIVRLAKIANAGGLWHFLAVHGIPEITLRGSENKPHFLAIVSVEPIIQR